MKYLFKIKENPNWNVGPTELLRYDPWPRYGFVADSLASFLLIAQEKIYPGESIENLSNESLYMIKQREYNGSKAHGAKVSWP